MVVSSSAGRKPDMAEESTLKSIEIVEDGVATKMVAEALVATRLEMIYAFIPFVFIIQIDIFVRLGLKGLRPKSLWVYCL